MCKVGREWSRGIRVALVAIVALALLFPAAALAGGKKKKKDAPLPQSAPARPQVEISKLVWPEPPNTPRIRYLNYFAGQKIPTETEEKAAKKNKQSWMDRLAGIAPENQKGNRMLPFQLLGPSMMAVDAEGQLYVPDQRVGAIFVFNTETREPQLIRNGFEARFALVNGIAIDDDGRLFVTDGKLHHVLVFNEKHQVVDQITAGLVDPYGVALDTENRRLYVVDTQQDQVFVFDADSFKLLRRLGTAGKKHELATPGDFSLPTGVAVDKEGNVYVSDTMNSRIEIFDADGNFVSQFGKNCDGPGCTPKPKGIALDADGHIWLADPMLDVLQVFNREGQVMAYLGGHGSLPGQFSSLVGVTIDKKNRVFASDQYPGRVQMFRYITNAEAEQWNKEKEAQRAGERAGKEQPAGPKAEQAPKPE